VSKKLIITKFFSPKEILEEKKGVTLFDQKKKKILFFREKIFFLTKLKSKKAFDNFFLRN